MQISEIKHFQDGIGPWKSARPKSSTTSKHARTMVHATSATTRSAQTSRQTLHIKQLQTPREKTFLYLREFAQSTVTHK